MGFTEDEIECNETATNLYGYHGDKRADVANIIIRRKAVNRLLSGGSSNDIGFKLQEDGTYGAIISEYDSRFASAKWLGQLSGNYAVHATTHKAKLLGYTVAGAPVKKNGKIQLQFVKS